MKFLSGLFPILFILNFTNGQQISSISTTVFTTPTDCLKNQFYDITRLACKNCPTNSAPSDLYNCKCNVNYYFTQNSGGDRIVCAPCALGLIQSLDGYTCVSCDSTCQNCPAGSYRSDTDVTGKYFPNFISQCIACDKDNSIASKSSCNACKPLVFLNSATTSIKDTSCISINDGIPIGGMLINPLSLSLTTPDPNDFNAYFASNTIVSCYYSKNLLTAFKLCQDSAINITDPTRPNRRNATACEVLGNICVLNLYNSKSNNVDACRAFTTLQNPINTGNTINNPSSSSSNQYGDNMPWIRYAENYGVLLNNYASFGTLDQQANFITLSNQNKCQKSNSLYFVAAQYFLNGTLSKYGKVDLSRFQLCNYLSSSFSKASQINPFSATNYLQSCQVDVASLIEYGSNLVFYDLFIKYNEKSGIYPVPILELNIIGIDNSEVNRGTNQNNYIMTRRFFLVDSVSGIQKDTTQTNIDCSSTTPKYIRYAKSIKLRFDLLPNAAASGTIYPPVVYIDYDSVSTDDLTKMVPIKFEIAYYMILDTVNLAVWISIGVLCAFSVIWAFFRIWIWNRRSGKLAPDMISLFKFAMFLVPGIANSFFIVCCGVSLYWLIFFKGQSVVFVVLPQAEQQSTFVILLVIAFVLKLIDIIHTILTQTSYDIFFIDWERPRHDISGLNSANNPSSLLPSIKKAEKSSKGDGAKEQLIKDDTENNVSCWRTLFVANEWNEIQTFRKINPTIQLVLVLFFLKVVNLEAFTTSDCNVSINPDPNDYQASYSSILRVGMAVSMYFGVALFQYLIYLFIYIRFFEDRIGQFCDFCSIANISMFIMTHTQYGYYIHGRSPHGSADTTMAKMTEALLNEENDLTAKRGLEKDSDKQNFSISISEKLSRQYSKVMIPIYERKTQRTDSGAMTQAEFEKRMVAYSQLNKFLMAFINNILREMQYVITRRNFFENIMDFEFKEPLNRGYFYADDDPSYKNVLFYGQERKLFVFDLLVFLIVDYFAQNYVLAGFILYIVIKIYDRVRDDLGRRNISRKTLVDSRFLI